MHGWVTNRAWCRALATASFAGIAGKAVIPLLPATFGAMPTVACNNMTCTFAHCAQRNPAQQWGRRFADSRAGRSQQVLSNIPNDPTSHIVRLPARLTGIFNPNIYNDRGGVDSPAVGSPWSAVLRCTGMAMAKTDPGDRRKALSPFRLFGRFGNSLRGRWPGPLATAHPPGSIRASTSASCLMKSWLQSALRRRH